MNHTTTVSACCGATFKYVKLAEHNKPICDKCGYPCTPTHSPKIGIDETMYASNQGTIQTTGTTPTETVSDKWVKKLKEAEEQDEIDSEKMIKAGLLPKGCINPRNYARVRKEMAETTYLFHPDNHLLDIKPTESDKDMEWRQDYKTSFCRECYGTTKTIMGKCDECKANKPIPEPTVEKWEERVCELIPNDKQEPDKLLDYIRTLLSHSVQEAKAEREKIVIADDGDYVKVPMTVIKHIWDMRMPQTSHWRESGEIHYNKAIEDILRLIKPNILSTLNTKASLKQEEGK